MLKRLLKKKVNVILLVLILIVVLFFLIRGYAEINFLVGEGLVLTSNLQTSFTLEGGDPADIGIQVNTNNDLLCKSFCEYSLINLEDNSVIINGSEMVMPGDSLNFNYEYIEGGKKEGQTLLVFEVTCSNLKTLICVKQTESATLTNLIVINYELSEEEKTLKEEVRERLNLILNKTIELDFKSQEIKAKSDTLGINYSETNLLIHIGDIEKIKEEWDLKEYFKAKDLLDSLNTFSLDAFEFILEDFDELNNTFEKLKDIRVGLIEIKEDSFALRNESIGLEFKDSVQLYNKANSKIFDDYNSSKYHLSDINLTNLTEMYYEFENFMINETNSSVSTLYGSLCEYDKTFCDIFYSIGSRNDFCSFVENTNTSLTWDILLFNQSFCIEVEYPRIKRLNEIFYEFDYKQRMFNNITDNLPECCVFGECKPCCVDCRDDPNTYPIIFIHGHAFNKESLPDYSLGNNFIALQNKLQEDGFINAGVLTPSASVSDVGYGEWGKSGNPVTVRLTYYYNFYRGDEGFVAVPQKNENIESYSIRLKEFIDLVKFRTGKEKVVLVAHSMGGLVARSYVNLFGGEDVYKMVLLATPNKGIDDHIASLCPVFGEEKECSDMEEGSVFLNKLNAKEEGVDMYVITATGCEMKYGMGDGIVLEENVPLDYATNFVVNGSCKNLLKNELHSDILEPSKYPEVYEILKKILKEEK